MRVPRTGAALRVQSLLFVGRLSLVGLGVCGLALVSRSAHAGDAAVDAVVTDAGTVDARGTGGAPQGGAGGKIDQDGGQGGAGGKIDRDGGQTDHDGGQGGAAGASHAGGGAGGAKTDGGVRADASYTLLTDSGSGCGCGVGFGAHRNSPTVALAGALAIVLTRVRRRRR